MFNNHHHPVSYDLIQKSSASPFLHPLMLGIPPAQTCIVKLLLSLVAIFHLFDLVLTDDLDSVGHSIYGFKTPKRKEAIAKAGMIIFIVCLIKKG